jgi:hypothetical protein
MFVDRNLESALGGDGFYRAQMRTAASTVAITDVMLPPSTATDASPTMTLGQLSAAWLALLIVLFVLFAYWVRRWNY